MSAMNKVFKEYEVKKKLKPHTIFRKKDAK